MDERNTTIIHKQETNENDAFISVIILAICVCGFITLAFIVLQARGCEEETARIQAGSPVRYIQPTPTGTPTPTVTPTVYYQR